jgi:hypothetical protein
MADRRLTPQKALVVGLTTTILTDILIADTHQVRNDGRVFLRCAKTGSTDAIFTFTTPVTVAGLAVANPTATVVATSGIMILGPFAPAVFNDASGDVEFTVDNVTGLKLEIVQL